MFTWIFWQDALERAIKTFAQVILATISADFVANPMKLLDADWRLVLATGAIGFLYSIITSIASSRRGNPQSASFMK